MAEAEASLDRDVRRYQKSAFEESSKTAYSYQLTRYLTFCNMYGYTPLPVTSFSAPVYTDQSVWVQGLPKVCIKQLYTVSLL